jgi:hypothetical protein
MPNKALTGKTSASLQSFCERSVSAMKSKIGIGLVACFLAVAATVWIYESEIIPIRLKRVDAYSIGVSDNTKNIISRIQQEFGSTNISEPSTQVLISNDDKVVLINETREVKTLKVYERKNH